MVFGDVNVENVYLDASLMKLGQDLQDEVREIFHSMAEAHRPDYNWRDLNVVNMSHWNGVDGPFQFDIDTSQGAFTVLVGKISDGLAAVSIVPADAS